MDDAAAQAESAQERRLASLQRRQELQSAPPSHSTAGSAVKFGAITVHSASLLAEICGEPEPEPEVESPEIRNGSGGSVSVNVDTLVGTLHFRFSLMLPVLSFVPSA